MARFVVQNYIYPYIFYMGSLFLQQPYWLGKKAIRAWICGAKSNSSVVFWLNLPAETSLFTPLKNNKHPFKLFYFLWTGCRCRKIKRKELFCTTAKRRRLEDLELDCWRASTRCWRAKTTTSLNLWTPGGDIWQTRSRHRRRLRSQNPTSQFSSGSGSFGPSIGGQISLPGIGYLRKPFLFGSNRVRVNERKKVTWNPSVRHITYSLLPPLPGYNLIYHNKSFTVSFSQSWYKTSSSSFHIFQSCLQLSHSSTSLPYRDLVQEGEREMTSLYLRRSTSLFFSRRCRSL